MRNILIYLFKKKSKVFEKFKEFKALVDSQIENKITLLEMDNGG